MQDMQVCADFGWGSVNFLHSSHYGAMFWICAENSVDNTGMFFVIAERCLDRIKAFSAPHHALAASGLGVHRKVGGGTAGTADPD